MGYNNNIASVCSVASLACAILACDAPESVNDAVGSNQPSETDNTTATTASATQTPQSDLQLRYTNRNGNVQNVTLKASAVFGNTTQYEKQSLNGINYGAVYVAGQDVNFTTFSYFSNANRTVFGADYYLDGNAVEPPSTGKFSYRGYYVASFTRQAQLATQTTPIVIEADFDKATIEGWDVPNQAVVRIDGTIDGDTHSGEIWSPQGTLSYSGGFYGTNANEISGGFKNGGVAGGFYGLYDQGRTDAIN